MIKTQEAESFVFPGWEKQKTRYVPLRHGGVKMKAHAGGTEYAEGVDFEVDYIAGHIVRTPGSRIPDWTSHPLSGVRAFDHTKFPTYSNYDYAVYATYEYEAAEGKEDSPSEVPETAYMDALREKLSSGGEILFAVLGDSISAGFDASDSGLAFFGRLSAWLKRSYPACRVTVENRAICGETSEGGVSRVLTDIAVLHPDLVTIGYGMNDQNRYEHGNGVSLADYERNIREMIDVIGQSCEAAVILVTPCEPNPLWKHTSGQIGEYADAIRRVGRELQIPVADAHAAWIRELEAGKSPESLLINNINHPSDYGHFLYFEAIRKVFQ